MSLPDASNRSSVDSTHVHHTTPPPQIFGNDFAPANLQNLINRGYLNYNFEGFFWRIISGTSSPTNIRRDNLDAKSAKKSGGSKVQNRSAKSRP